MRTLFRSEYYDQHDDFINIQKVIKENIGIEFER
jgi:hypothetical protein